MNKNIVKKRKDSILRNYLALIMAALIVSVLFTFAVRFGQRQKVALFKPPSKEPYREKEEKAVIQIDLVDLQGGDMTATLEVTFDEFVNSSQYHLEMGNFNIPEPGAAYEAWLRAESGVMMSLGDLKISKDAGASLDFSLTDESRDFYKSVIISFRESGDEISGKLIMEGTLAKE